MLRPSVLGVKAEVSMIQEYKKVGLQAKPEKTKICLGDFEIGGAEFIVMAGPCIVETREQLFETAIAVKMAGARILRGNAFRVGISPYDFQDLREDELRLLADVGRRTGLKVVTETISAEQVELVAEYADILQVGGRHMQDFALLKRLGRAGRPVLLERSWGSTLNEFLLAAEYIAAGGNDQIILCERGIRTFETATNQTLDLVAVPILQGLSHLPVVVDPSNGTGHRHLIKPAAKAAVAIGADGLMMEVASRPPKASEVSEPTIDPAQFQELMIELHGYVGLEARYIESARALA